MKVLWKLLILRKAEGIIFPQFLQQVRVSKYNLKRVRRNTDRNLTQAKEIMPVGL